MIDFVPHEVWRLRPAALVDRRVSHAQAEVLVANQVVAGWSRAEFEVVPNGGCSECRGRQLTWIGNGRREPGRRAAREARSISGP